jgi:RecA/RadA recombinase
MSSLLDKLKASGTVKATTLSDSVIFENKEFVKTDIPIINVALSGQLDGGLSSGLTLICGPSKHFKSNLGLVMVKSYLNQYSDSICLFYDSEFGITPEYIKSHGVDPDRCLHIPIEDIEQLKFDINKRLKEITKKDKVIIFIDSVGNLASKKEVEDADAEKSVADMSRAKGLKSLFRIVTPHLTIKDIPCIVINHVYKTMELYSKDVVSGGTGIYYSANSIFIIGRTQEKDSDGISGWNFSMNVEKSRYVKEKSKLIFQVTYEGGLGKYGGLIDEAMEAGLVIKPSNGWYSKVGEDRKWRLADTNCEEFWGDILKSKEFDEFLKNKYILSYKSNMKGNHDV